MRNHWLNGDFPMNFRQTHVSEKLKKMVDYYDYHSVMEIYSDIFGICMDMHDMIKGSVTNNRIVVGPCWFVVFSGM
jgi:hypothetical protein